MLISSCHIAYPPGIGLAIWHEDISKLSQLHREVEKSTVMLTEANAMLMEEEKVKRLVNEKNAKNELMEQLELEITESIVELKNMIEILPYSRGEIKDTTRIALLLCYIKRRCNLFFQEKEKESVSMDEIILYIDELIEISKHSNVEIACINEIKGSIHIRYATLFYDFFYEVANLAIESDCSHIIGDFETDEESFKMGFLFSEDIGTFKEDSKLLLAINAAKGKLVIKDLEDSIGISISFPKGGLSYD